MIIDARVSADKKAEPPSLCSEQTSNQHRDILNEANQFKDMWRPSFKPCPCPSLA